MSATGRKGEDVHDRRALRTRRALRAALALLLERKRWDDITVQDLAAEADVGRSSFYAHFNGKEDLLRQGLRTLREEIWAECAGARGFGFSRPLLEHVLRHRSLNAGLRGRADEVVMDEIRALVLELAARNLDQVDYDRTVPRELVVQFVAGAFMSLLAWWRRRNSSLSPAELDLIFQRLAAQGIGGRAAGASPGADVAPAALAPPGAPC